MNVLTSKHESSKHCDLKNKKNTYLLLFNFFFVCKLLFGKGFLVLALLLKVSKAIRI